MNVDDNPLIIDGVNLSDYTGTRKATLDELLPKVEVDKEMTLAGAEAEGYNLLPKELTDEERYIQATMVKLPELDKLPQLTEEDLKGLHDDKELNLTSNDLSDLDDNSFKLPKPPML